MSATVATGLPLSSCREASVRYGAGESRVEALATVDLDIARGESIALQGSSGSGKTTLLNLLGGLLVPTAGEVLWRCERLSSLDAAARGRARAAGIAFVFQGANLLPGFSAFENVSFAAWIAARAGLEVRHEAADLLRLVGLEGKGAALPAELSGGEAQRVAIARALAQAPELLLCDEPTGHLDSDTAVRVLDLLDRIHERFGFALIVATHDDAVARRYGRRVELRDGHLTADVRR